MKKLILTVLLVFALTNIINANENNCIDFKKLSSGYFKCKANLLKEKSISFSRNFINDTKEYQKKEWSKEKDKMNTIKEKVLNK